MESILDYLGGPNIITSLLLKWKSEADKKEIWRYYAADFQSGRRSYQPKNVGGL